MTTTTTSTTPSTDPRIVANAFSAACVKLSHPLVITGIFVDLLTSHFGTPEWIEEPRLRKLVWKPTPDTGILIEPQFRWTPQMANKRPSIIIKRNAWASEPRGIGDDICQGNPLQSPGMEKYLVQWVGSHTIFCTHTTGASAELLGAEVARELGQFAKVYRDKLGFLRVRVTQIGDLSKLEEDQESLVVPVTIGYAFEEKFSIMPQAPRLRSIGLSMTCFPE